MKLLKLVPDDTNIGFLRWRKLAMTISLLSIIASIALVTSISISAFVDVASTSCRIAASKSSRALTLNGCFRLPGSLLGIFISTHTRKHHPVRTDQGLETYHQTGILYGFFKNGTGLSSSLRMLWR